MPNKATPRICENQPRPTSGGTLLGTPTLRVVRGAASWHFATNAVEAYLTRRGGHLAPVTFKTAGGKFQPYAIAPWSTEHLPRDTPDLLRTLRGDFFCLPFGGNVTPWRGERHPPHGETASAIWQDPQLRSLDDGVEFSVKLRTKVRPGLVVKRLRLRENETNVYCEHELIGFSGPMSIGHHAMLRFPAAEGSGRITFSPWRRGQVSPVPPDPPGQGSFSCLKLGAKFTDLRRVPLDGGGLADLTRYPARAGFEDLVMLTQKRLPRLAWAAVVFPDRGYLWFSLKEVRTLASTVLWHSNGGRHYLPWSGRHRNVLGLEDITGNFALGLAESVFPNALNRCGIATVLHLHEHRSTVIRYVMGVAAIPRSFGPPSTVRFSRDHLTFVSASGARVTHPLYLRFFKPPAV